MKAAIRLVSVGLVSLTLAGAAQAAVLEGERLASIYDLILEARFDAARQQLSASCPPAPDAACRALDTARLWWQILMDPESRLLDSQLEKSAAHAVEAADAWTRREPGSAEAWFYLAAAHAPLVQWQALRGQHLSAARTGGRIREALERSLDLDPALHDARFGIGLYRYYADIAPAAARLLRWLLFLPGGDRVDGLRQMLDARAQGLLTRGEADYQLHWLYLWYEQEPLRALELLEGLDARYPSNPLFLKRIAEVQRDYFHDRPASAAVWRTLLDRARGADTRVSLIAEVNARLGLAVELDAMFETDRAIDQLTAVLGLRPEEPHGALALAHLQLADAYGRIGRRTLAIAEYQTAANLATDDATGTRIRNDALRGLRNAPDPTAADAYRLSLEGLRALERGDDNDAVAVLQRAVSMTPGDLVTRYRLASALRTSGDVSAALTHLDRVVTARPLAPPVVRASAYFDYGAMLEAAGERARAVEMYRHAQDTAGGSLRARADARSALERLER